MCSGAGSAWHTFLRSTYGFVYKLILINLFGFCRDIILNIEEILLRQLHSIHRGYKKRRVLIGKRFPDLKVAMGNSGSSSRTSPQRNSRYDRQPSSWYVETPPSVNAYNQETSTPALASPPPPLSKPQSKAAIGRRYSQKYSVINDNYNSLEEVQRALGQAGLESSNLIVGIDYTKSNEWTGKTSFGGRSLHAIGNELNPYEKAISIVGETLTPFDEDNLIPCFGFGDSSTHDKHVFSFFSDNRPCEGFEEALMRYRTIVPHVRLAGPTSFAPIINAAVDIVEQSGGQYHVLIIIAGLSNLPNLLPSLALCTILGRQLSP